MGDDGQSAGEGFAPALQRRRNRRDHDLRLRLDAVGQCRRVEAQLVLVRGCDWDELGAWRLRWQRNRVCRELLEKNVSIGAARTEGAQAGTPYAVDRHPVAQVALQPEAGALKADCGVWRFGMQ